MSKTVLLGTEVPIHGSAWNFAAYYFGVEVLTFLMAAAFCLLFEAPFLAMRKLVRPSAF